MTYGHKNQFLVNKDQFLAILLPSRYLYSVGFGSVIDTVSAHDDAVSCLCLRRDILISGSWDATVKVWQFKGNSLNRLPLAEFTDHDTEIHCVDVDTQCTVAASGAADGEEMNECNELCRIFGTL